MNDQLARELGELLEDHEDDLDLASAWPSMRGRLLDATRLFIEHLLKVAAQEPDVTTDSTRAEIKKLHRKLEALSAETTEVLGTDLSRLKERCSAYTQSRVRPNPIRDALADIAATPFCAVGARETASRSGITVRYLDIVQKHAGLLNEQGEPLHDSRQIVRDFLK
jgi:hypothetical protein